jgi:AAA domain
MRRKSKPQPFKMMNRLVQRLRDDLKTSDFVLLFAYNGTGKTRLSMAFKEAGKTPFKRPFRVGDVVGQRLEIDDHTRDTLYFNAYTEDLFNWDNDLDGDSARVLRINSQSTFFEGFKELALEDKIFAHLVRYADFEFKIDYVTWAVSFSRNVTQQGRAERVSDIKVSRGEENLFIWCVFLALIELVTDGAQAYAWVKYIYIDDPISSLDDNNAIAVASHLSALLRKGKDRLKTVVSSHHGLFFNVMHNELKKQQTKSYFLYKSKNDEGHTLQATTDTPFFHHVAMLTELKTATQSGELYTHHFNMLRSIMEKTATFFGFDDFSSCLDTQADMNLHGRVLNLLSHGNYALFEPREMLADNKDLFKTIFSGFLTRFAFALPELTPPETTPKNQL